MTLRPSEIAAVGRIAETCEVPARWIIELAIRQFLAGEGADILAVRSGRDQIAAGMSVDFDEVLDDIDRIIAGGPTYDWEREAASLPVIVRHPGVMSGQPVYRGTRVQASTLFVQLAAGDTLDEVMDSWPTLTRAECKIALDQAWRALAGAAPTINDHDLEALARIRAQRDESG